MDYYTTVFEIIDMRSFSNLWYWLVLAVLWSSASHFMLGVPFDLFRRAKSQGGSAEQDVKDLVRIYCNRVNYIMDLSGNLIIGVTFFLLTTLVSLGFFYGNEFCQAVFFLAAPLSLIGAINARRCRQIGEATMFNDSAKLFKVMSRYRLTVQIIGTIDIAVASMWGITYNFAHASLVG